MKIEAVTVCVDFSEKLEKIILNKKKLDRWVIVTHESDKDTINVCKKFKLEYICSKKIFKNAKFAKGRAINEGLRELDKDDWILHIDSDQLLPEDFREKLLNLKLSKNKLYGAYRFSKSGKKFPPARLTFQIKDTKEDKIITEFINAYIPIGYFQLWHSSVRKTYVARSRNTLKDDYHFITSWKTDDISIEEFRSNIVMLDGIDLIDVCGYTGSDLGHYIGLRNIQN